MRIMSPIIEVQFLGAPLMLGPEAREREVIEWWEANHSTAGSHWYAAWYMKWVASGCDGTVTLNADIAEANARARREGSYERPTRYGDYE